MSFGPNPIDLRIFWRSQAYDFRSKSNRFEDVLEVQVSFLKHLVACTVRTLELFVKTVLSLWFKAKLEREGSLVFTNHNIKRCNVRGLTNETMELNQHRLE